MGERLIPEEKHYTIDEKSGCWNYRNYSTRGYGTIWFNSKCVRAPRYFYEKYKGKIPEGLTIDHLCKNTRCVNPEHLEAVPWVENMRRAGLTKLDTNKVMEIRKMGKSGISPKTISEIMKISRGHIVRILNNIYWKPNSRWSTGSNN